MNSDFLNRLHECELMILDEVVRLCKEHNIQYFLTAGSLLGAIRHKGFIPWDDDLDICMPRNDYNRFLNIAMDCLDKRFFLHCSLTDPEYWLPFAKVRMNNTSFVEPAIEKISTHKGIFIDIFPLDNASKQRSYIQKVQAKITKHLNSLIIFKRGVGTRTPTLRKRLELKLLSGVTIKELLALQQKIMSWSTNDNSEYYVNLGSNYDYVKQTMPKSKYFPATEVEFEGRMLSAPGDWDYLLKRIYGDYMQLPPPEKRRTHDPVEISFNIEGD